MVGLKTRSLTIGVGLLAGEFISVLVEREVAMKGVEIVTLAALLQFVLSLGYEIMINELFSGA